jgi:hypothetical protein
MTDEIGTRKRERFSSIEVVSVAAITVILVMIAVPFPYANRNHALPALHTASDGGSVADDTWSGDTLKSAGVGNASSVGYPSQGSTYEVRTLGKREFCADMPGVVRFRTTGASCRNGTTITSAQRHRDQQEKP